LTLPPDLIDKHCGPRQSKPLFDLDDAHLIAGIENRLPARGTPSFRMSDEEMED
jgi:hypothetical protein